MHYKFTRAYGGREADEIISVTPEAAKELLEAGVIVPLYEDKPAPSAPQDRKMASTPRASGRNSAAVLALLALLLGFGAQSAQAAVASRTLIASQAITASGNTTPVAVPTVTQGEIKVFVTAASGTGETLDLWAESCQDAAANDCAPIVADTYESDTATPGTVQSSMGTLHRDIVDNKTTTTSETFTVKYSQLPSPFIRLRWIISGTTPSFTVAAYFNGK